MTRAAPSALGNGPIFAIGLMSGTSADGIDAVLARISGAPDALEAKVAAHVHTRFTPRFRERILNLCLQGTVAQVCEMNFELGEKFAAAAKAVIVKAGVRPLDVTVIGSHGQTIQHLPGARHPSTLQIGDPCVIAERTGISTVGDFRVRDIAAGGQGAPLVAFADWALFRHPRYPTIIQNIGGIGNLTFIPPASSLEEVLAFDTGPGNMVIDALISRFTGSQRSYDRDGKWAAKGTVSESLLRRAMAHPFFRRPPPKTTGREEFGLEFANDFACAGCELRLKKVDVVATATALTAESIAGALKHFVWPRMSPTQISTTRMILGGGGAANPILKKMIKSRIGTGSLLTHQDFGIADAAKEALAFAILARETIHSRPANVPSATGARRAVILGKMVPASIL